MACTNEEIISLCDRIMAFCNRLNKKLDEYGEFPSSFHEQPVPQQPYGHPPLVEVGFHPPYTQPPESPDWQRPYRPHAAHQPDRYLPLPPYQPEPSSDMPATFFYCHTMFLWNTKAPIFVHSHNLHTCTLTTVCLNSSSVGIYQTSGKRSQPRRRAWMRLTHGSRSMPPFTSQTGTLLHLIHIHLMTFRHTPSTLPRRFPINRRTSLIGSTSSLRTSDHHLMTFRHRPSTLPRRLPINRRTPLIGSTSSLRTSDHQILHRPTTRIISSATNIGTNSHSPRTTPCARTHLDNRDPQHMSICPLTVATTNHHSRVRSSSTPIGRNTISTRSPCSTNHYCNAGLPVGIHRATTVQQHRCLLPLHQPRSPCRAAQI